MHLSRQARLVLDHLYSNAHLTSWHAEGVYRIRRLASRISELKNAGYAIMKKRCKDATGQAYTRYSLARTQRRTTRPLNPAVQSQRRFTPAELREAYVNFAMNDLCLVREEAEEEADNFINSLPEGK